MAIPLSYLIAMQRRQALRLNQQIVDQELAKVLRDAARDGRQMAREIASYPGVGAATRQAQLRFAAESASSISEKLWFNAGELTREGIFRAADLAALQATDLDKVIGMPLTYIQGYEEALRGSARISAESIIARRQFGYTLSQRIYRNTALTTGRLTRVIESGLVNNLSARELARQVGPFIDPKVPGGASYSAMRLARTEINNAHHWVSAEQYKDRPWISGVAWNLSGSHPKPDACDDLAENGPYPRDEVPDKPHPQCLCYITPELPSQDEFLDSLLGGDYNDWLMDNSNERIICHSSCVVLADNGVTYQRWDTDEERQAWMDRYYGDDYLVEMTQEEENALDRYITGESDVLNRVYRLHEKPDWLTQEGWIKAQADAQADLTPMLSLARKQPLPENLILHRGVDERAAKIMLEKGFYTDTGFMSTSLDVETAEAFAGSSGFTMELEVPKGTLGIGVSPTFTDEMGGGNEWEVILAPGTKIEFLVVDQIAKRILARVVR